MRDLVNFFRRNPQALMLLIICVVLGLGTFFAVIISLVTSGSGTPSGEPSGAVWLLSALVR